MASNNISSKGDQGMLKSEEKPVTNKEVKLEDREWQLNKDLATSMLTLYDQQLWTDITFSFEEQTTDGDEEKLRAHKIVLAARSPVFAAMFFGPCADGSESVKVKEVTKDTMDLFLRYIYSDETEVTDEQAVEIMKLAHFYQVPTLLQFCAEYMEDKFADENVCTFLDLALLYDIEKMKKDASRYIDNNVKNVLESEEFLKISKACLTYILKGDTLFADEEFIFERTMTWAREACRLESIKNPDGPKLRETLGEAFYYLRVPTMDAQTFSRCTKRKGLYSICEHEDILEYIVNETENQVASHCCTNRTLEKEVISFEENLSSKQISTGTVVCSLNVIVGRRCKFLGFQLIPPTVKDLYGSETELPEHMLKSLKFSISIPDMSFEYSDEGICGDIYLEAPLVFEKDNEFQINFELDLSCLYGFEKTVGRRAYKQCGDRKSLFQSAISLSCPSQTTLSGDFGNVSTLSGKCFVKEIILEHFSTRE